MSERTKTYFISDLHLGAAYIDNPHERERLVCAFFDEIKNDAASIYLVGDIFDYWFEYKTVVPRGHVRFLGTLAAMADAGVKIVWLTGNHDIWLFDYLNNELGIKVVDGALYENIGGRNFFISHGDGLGKLPLGFRIIRSIFHNRFCQIIYSAIHPRWTVGFAYWWSARSRKFDNVEKPVFDNSLKNNILTWARAYTAENPSTDYIILGHHHVAVDMPVSDNCQLIILGDWIYNFTYAVYDGNNVELKQYDSSKHEFNNISH